LNGYGAARSGQAIAQAAASTNRGRPTNTGSARTVSVPVPANSLSTYTSNTGLFRISYPSNWQVYESGSTGVTIAPPGGAGNVNGSNQVVYGAIINHYDPFGNQQSGNISLQSATQDLIAAIEQSSPYLRLASSNAQVLRLAGGGTALGATLRGTDPATGIDERVTVVTRQLSDEHLLYMLFVTPERDAANYSSVLNAMVSSLQINTNQRH
jgi:hypothetical protein